MNIRDIINPWKRIRELERELSCQQDLTEKWHGIADMYWHQKAYADKHKAEMYCTTPYCVAVNNIPIRQFDTGDKAYDKLLAEELIEQLNSLL